jgi:chondroitin sulfate proteoglycan 4
MSAVSKAFSGSTKYQDVLSGSTVWRTMKPVEENFSCKNGQRSSVNLLDSSKYKLMENAVQPMHSNPLYVEKLEIFTHISVTNKATKLHEKVPLIFVANKEGYIKKLSVLPRTKQTCLIEILELEKGPSQIEAMEYVEESDSLYVGKYLKKKLLILR